MHDISKNKILLSDEVKNLVEELGRSRNSLLPILQKLVDKKNYISQDEVRQLAFCLDLNPTEIYSVASYYSFLTTKPVGKYVIWVCESIVCEMNSNKEILNTIKSLLNIDVNQTTKDGLFTLKTTPCLGLCYKSPAIMINETVYTEVDDIKIKSIIFEIKNDSLFLFQDSLISELDDEIFGDLDCE